MSFVAEPAFTTRPTLNGTFGVAASTHWIATATAQSVLERGGNAFDAAVAAGFVLHVVEPHLNGPGGDLTGLFRTPSGGVKVLMGQGPAPAEATIEHYRDVEGLADIPGSGALAAAVPGSVPAWLHLLAEHGTWELHDVLSYAIGYARDGHPIAPAVATMIGRMREHFLQNWPTSAARWLREDGMAPRAGETVVNRRYAAVLDRLVAAGRGAGSRIERIEAARREWAEGFVAAAVDGFVRTPHRHGEGRDHAGVLRASDMAAFRAREESPVTIEFRGATVHKTGPWAQGPVLLQMLAILDAYGRLHGVDDEHLDPSTASGIHVIAEAEKLALADRDAWYGDPEFTEVPLTVLLSPEYAEERARLIGERASAELRPGSPGGRVPHLPDARAERSANDGLAGAGGGAGESAGQSGGEMARAAGDMGSAGPASTGLTSTGRTSTDGAGVDTPDGSAGTGSAGTGSAGADAAGIGEPTVDRYGATRGDTCHLDVADRFGNVVTITPSGGWLQSSPTIPELGFCLGTRLQMAWLDDGSPSALRPGARPRTTLSATLVTVPVGEDEGGPALDTVPAAVRVIALGTPGGDQQDQWQLPALLRMLVGGWSPQAAIDAPTFHTTSHLSSFWPRVWDPAGLVVEERVGADVIAQLRERGHRVTVAGGWSLGRLSGAGALVEAGAEAGEQIGRRLWSAANPRGAQGYAAGR